MKGLSGVACVVLNLLLFVSCADNKREGQSSDFFNSLRDGGQYLKDEDSPIMFGTETWWLETVIFSKRSSARLFAKIHSAVNAFSSPADDNESQ